MHLRFGARPRRAYVPRPVPEPHPILATIQAVAAPPMYTAAATVSAPVPPPAPAPDSRAPAAAGQQYVRRRPGRFSRYTPQRPVSRPVSQPAAATSSSSAPAPATPPNHVSSAAPLSDTYAATPTSQPAAAHPHHHPRHQPRAVPVPVPTPRIRKFSTATYDPPVSTAAMPITYAPPVLLVGGANAVNLSGSAAITNRKRREPASASQGCVSCGIRSRWHSSKKTLN